MSRYAYLVIQDETTWPVQNRSDVQRHVLGVHTSLTKANVHLLSCVRSRADHGFIVARTTPFDYDPARPNETKMLEHYMSNAERSLTCAFELHKCKLARQ